MGALAAGAFKVKAPDKRAKPVRVPNQLIVKFKDGTTEDQVQARFKKHGAQLLSASARGRFCVIRVSGKKGTDAALKELRADTAVAYAEPNSFCYKTGTPNDEYYPDQWHLDDEIIPNPNGGTNGGGINIEPAWDKTTGQGVIVAILDTGVAYEDYLDDPNGKDYAQAPDLANTTFVPGWDFVNGDSHPNDDEGHGTHVTGTVAQSTNNDIGVAGVAYGASIMPVKVLDETGSGTAADLADALYFAADNGADVISMSLGWGVVRVRGQWTAYYPGDAVRDAVEYAYNKGVTIVAASSNDGQAVVGYPAAFDDWVIAVGATRYDETLAPYSNTGDSLDIVAPGGDTSRDDNDDGFADGVLQQTMDSPSELSTFSYWFYQGTSMATPHVAGLAALIISQGVDDPDMVRLVIESSAEDKGTAGWDPDFGNGLIDASAAVDMTESMPVITGPGTLSDGDWGISSTATFTATGDATIDWSVTAGSLPDGMSLDSNTGEYSGTPTVAGLFTFTITATNSLGIDNAEYSHTILPGASVGDYVWNDGNENGIQDSGELGVAGVTVRLIDDATDVEVATQQTDVDGLYLFDPVAIGAYRIAVDLPSGSAFTATNQGGDDDFDSDVNPTSGESAAASVSSGDSKISLDAGLVDSVAMSVTIDSFTSDAAGFAATYSATQTGSGPLYYKVYLVGPSGWGLLENWSVSTSVDVPALAVGTYYLHVQASTSSDGPWQANRSSAIFTVGQVDAATAVTINAFTPNAAGFAAMYSATQTGTGPIYYKVYLVGSSGWTLLENWSTSTSVDVPALADGTYYLHVQASTSSNGPWQANLSSANFTVGQVDAATAVTINAFTPNAAGFTATYSATQTGTGTLYYKVYLVGSSGWTLLENWSTSTSVDVPALADGTYCLHVQASTGPNGPWQANHSSVNFTVGQVDTATAVTINAFTPNAAGFAVTCSATQTGTGPLYYKVYYVDSSGWNLLQNWSTATTVNIPALADGSYYVHVQASTSSNGPWQANESTASFLIGQVTGATSVTIDSFVPDAGGFTVTYSATQTGADPLYYQVWVRGPAGWVLVQDWSTAASAAVPTLASGDYFIHVQVSTSASGPWQAVSFSPTFTIP